MFGAEFAKAEDLVNAARPVEYALSHRRTHRMFAGRRALSQFWSWPGPFGRFDAVPSSRCRCTNSAPCGCSLPPLADPLMQSLTDDVCLCDLPSGTLSARRARRAGLLAPRRTSRVCGGWPEDEFVLVELASLRVRSAIVKALACSRTSTKRLGTASTWPSQRTRRRMKHARARTHTIAARNPDD
ncbi:hypothetical protein BD309DRAFT_957312 [Dichomitus squalens]|uniref:Uncharacterized protein n=1 Tax=Dichomitus squalens TaxID=114155 RepID=A0A4Q9NW43_9APHY|nr:hypothetical protein BD309DRAFT_957312 [Dichomitus squalens]TBU56487.1 hypothetical protein BD310DRAFT_931254 [Dichomitus squalens]